VSATTEISWSDATWNPLIGCTKVSAGCQRCYAEGVVNRFVGTGEAWPARFDTVSIRPDRFLTQPLRWTKPRRVFVNSLSDLFHKDVPDEFIAKVFAIMAVTPRHTYQLLTKRHGRMESLLSSDRFAGLLAEQIGLVRGERGSDYRDRSPIRIAAPLPNVWLGVSVEDQAAANLRIPALLRTPAAIRFLSMEPLLGPVDLTRVAYTDGGGTHLDVVHGRHGVPDVWVAAAKKVDWVIVGGESGAGFRPMAAEWARVLRDQCQSAQVPFFFKQWGGARSKSNGNELDGVVWEQFPG
jgi:protein gp37